MAAKRWLKTVRNLLPRRPLSSRTRPPRRLFVEPLEDRLTPSNTITTIAGTGSAGYGGDNGPATAAMLYTPFGTAVDSSGNVFIADTTNHRVREVVKATGNIVTVAGNGSPFYNGDNMPATSAAIGYPHGVAVDGSGNLFIADSYNNRIREVVKATGNIITVAGNGTAGYGGDNGPATSAALNYPWSVAVDGSGNVFIADTQNNRVREVVQATGNIVTVAGTGGVGSAGDGGPATSATMNTPSQVAVDPASNLFIADSGSNRVREVTKATGVISTVAGIGSGGSFGDGGPATSAALNYPNGVAVDAAGNVYIADTYNYRIREVFGSNLPYLGTLSSTAWTVNQPGYSGTLSAQGGTTPYGSLTTTGLPPGLTAALSGSTITVGGTPTTAGTFNATFNVLDAGGNRASRTFSITVNAVPTLGALSPTQGTAGVSYTGSIPISGGTGPLYVSAQANLPPGLNATVSGTKVTFVGIPNTAGTYSNVQVTVRDAAGATASGTYSITIVTPAPGTILTAAGNGTGGYNGDYQPASLALLYGPRSVATDAAGNVYIADTNNNRVREIVKATGLILTVAGTGVSGYSGDNGPATSARLNGPTGVAVDANGNLFIADTYNNRVREVVRATGNIITVAGNGSFSYSGDGGPATSAGLASPQAVAVDANGNLYVADASNNRVREVKAGIIFTVAGSGGAGYSGDGGPATSAKLSNPTGVAVDAVGNLYISDTNNQRVREVINGSGIIFTFAGTGTAGYGGDNGPAQAAKLNAPQGLAVDANGNLYIADVSNYRIREVLQANGTITTVAGSGNFGYGGDGSPATSASVKMWNAYGVAVDGTGDLFIADSVNNAVREVLGNPSPVLGALSSTAWTVNQPGFNGTIAITSGTAPYSFQTVTGLPPGLTVSLSGSTITVGGTPSAVGTYSNFTIGIRDANGNSATRTYSITVNAAPALGTLAPTQWTVGRAGYTGAIPLSGGTGALTVSAQSNLPPGLSAAVSGSSITFTGTPTTAGTYGNVQLTVRDTTGATSTRTFSITVNPAPTLGALSSTAWTVNQPSFSGTIGIVGGTGPFSNLTTSAGGTGTSSNQTATGLPPGLSASLSGSTVTVSGTPTATGTYSNISITVVDATGATTTGIFSITINAAPALGTLAPTQWTAGQSGYTGAIPLSGGTGPLTISAQSNLPPGLSATVTGTNVTFTGMPTTAGTFGNASITVQDATGVASTGTFSITINPAPALGALSSSVWTVNQPGFNATIAVIGGTGSYSSLTASNLPPGLTAALSGSTITVSGTPTTAGAFPNVQLTVQDATGAAGSGTFTITINNSVSGPSLGALSPTAWTVNQAGFNGTIPVSSGLAPYSNLTVTGLPAGLTAALSGSTITVNGTPTSTGTFNINATVNDANGAIANAGFSLTINAAPALGALSSTAWTVNQPGFSGTLAVTGGTGPLGFSASNLPPGLTAALSGGTITVSGTPTAAGTYGNVGISVTDAAGVTASGTFSITINAAPALSTLTPAQWTVGRPGYPGAIPVSGGTGPLTLTAQSSLPPGLSAALSGTNIVFSGTPTTAGTYGNVQLTVQDAAGVTSSGTFAITVSAAPALGTLPATAWTVNQPGYSSTINVTGGTGPLGNLTATGLPAGLTASLSGNTVTVSGTPTATGAFTNVTIGVVDAAGASASRTYTLIINAALTMGTLTPTQWTVNQPGYSGTITVPGGTGPWGLASQANLPPGLSAGLRGGVASPLTIFFTGTPTTVGTYSNVQFTVQDSVGATVSGTFSITITATPPLITTIAGNGGQGYNGDDITATSAMLSVPFGVAVDGSGNVFFADEGNNRVREIVKATGTIITVAGTGTAGYGGDGGPATAAQLHSPYGVAVDASGNLFIGDGMNNRVREVVKATGNIITVAGNGTLGFSGDGGPATSAALFDPFGVAVDASGNLFIADYANERIREVVKATGNIITIAGNGTQGYGGDGGPATAAMLSGPFSVAVDASGNVLFADAWNNRIREVVKATGNIITIAGTGASGFSGDGGPATAAQLSSPEYLALDAAGNLFISDNGNNRIREVPQATGIITTIAGVGTYGFSGDGGPATAAQLAAPKGVAVDASGNVIFADQNNSRIREVLSGSMGPQTASPATPNPSGFSGTATTLTSADLQPIVAEAIRRWTAAGLSRAQLARLRAVQFQVVDLSATVPNEVGLALPGVVQLDATAAGFGWFVDPTPANDSEFAGHKPPPAGMDLLTVVMHELGHELGLPDLDAAAHPGDVMAEGLAPGVRLARVSPYDRALLGLATRDAFFAKWKAWTF